MIDHWWQTETGWAISAVPMGIEALPVKHGSPGVPVPGYDVQVLDDGGGPVAAGGMVLGGDGAGARAGPAGAASRFSPSSRASPRSC